MKITKSQLKEIIEEELSDILKELAPRFGTKEAVAEAIIGKGLMKDGLKKIIAAAMPVVSFSDSRNPDSEFSKNLAAVEKYIREECAPNIMKIMHQEKYNED